MTIHVERITPIVKLNLKLQCLNQVWSDAYILVSWTRAIAQLAAGGVKYLKIVLNLLIA